MRFISSILPIFATLVASTAAASTVAARAPKCPLGPEKLWLPTTNLYLWLIDSSCSGIVDWYLSQDEINDMVENFTWSYKGTSNHSRFVYACICRASFPKIYWSASVDLNFAVGREVGDVSGDSAGHLIRTFMNYWRDNFMYDNFITEIWRAGEDGGKDEFMGTIKFLGTLGGGRCGWPWLDFCKAV